MRSIFGSIHAECKIKFEAIGRVNKSENDIYNKLYVVLKVHKVPDLHKKTGTKEFEKYRREA